MTRICGAVSLSAAIALFATTCIGAAAPASAQQLVNAGIPPLEQFEDYAEGLASPNKFLLTSQDDVELIRFKRVHDLSICVGLANRDAIGPARHAYPINVSWDDNVGVVTPGNCLTVDAQRVKVRPAVHIPQDVEVTGTIHILK